MAKLYLVKGRIFYEDKAKLALLNGAILESKITAPTGNVVQIIIRHFKHFIGGM